MPHATQTVTNGEKPSSQFLNHLTSYPVVHDGIETFKSNPYGQKSIEIADGVYTKFGKPVEPYLETPYSYAKPYVQKADSLANSGLGTVESHFPIVKEDTDTIMDNLSGLLQPVMAPVIYLMNTWNDEYEKTAKHKNRGPGVSTSVMALISTELRVASDFFHGVADYLGPKYEEGKENAQHLINNVDDEAKKYQKLGQEKVGEYQKLGQEKLDELLKQGQITKEEAQKKAEGVKEDAKKQTQK